MGTEQETDVSGSTENEADNAAPVSEQSETTEETQEAAPVEETEETEAKADDAETEEEPAEEEKPETAEEKEKRRRKGGWERRAERAERRAEQAERERALLLEQIASNQPKPPAKELAPEEQAAEFVQNLVRQGIAAEREQERQQAAQTAFRAKTEETRTKYADFDDVMEAAPPIPLPPTTRQAILTSPEAPAIMYQLAKSPAELARISRLPPLEAALEIGRLEARLTSSTPVQRTTSKPATRPPPPPTTVGGSSKSTRDITDLPISEYKRRFRSGR